MDVSVSKTVWQIRQTEGKRDMLFDLLKRFPYDRDIQQMLYLIEWKLERQKEELDVLLIKTLLQEK